jgi:hypothetical protein
VPTPKPTPTPTPDPWADQFHISGGAYVNVKDAANGPWIYKDAQLSVEIRYTRGGPRNRYFYRAEIYARGALPFHGFSFMKKASPGRGDTEMPYRIARRYGAVLGIMADYYTRDKGDAVVVGGSKYVDKTKNSTLAVMPDGSLKAYDPGEITAEQLIEMGVKDSFSFGPILVKDGAIYHKSFKKLAFATGKYEYRTGIGQVEPGHYIAIVTKQMFSLEELAQLFIDNGCTMAYNLDGGHSACMVFMGEQLNLHKESGILKGVFQRPVPDLLMFGANPAVPDVDDKVYCDGSQTYPKNKPEPTEGIIPEAAGLSTEGPAA